MRAMWLKLRAHLLSWHMLPCLVMIVFAVGAVIATGRASALLGAVGCMVMMAAMGGHNHSGHSKEERDN
jgi:TRAP-type mannitol/chloroaromatic compound transport system permease large subunit